MGWCGGGWLVEDGLTNFHVWGLIWVGGMIEMTGAFLYIAHPAGKSGLIHKVSATKEVKLQCSSLFQVSTCVIFSNILLAKPNHITKPRFKCENIDCIS